MVLSSSGTLVLSNRLSTLPTLGGRASVVGSVLGAVEHAVDAGGLGAQDTQACLSMALLVGHGRPYARGFAPGRLDVTLEPLDPARRVYPLTGAARFLHDLVAFRADAGATPLSEALAARCQVLSTQRPEKLSSLLSRRLRAINTKALCRLALLPSALGRYHGWSGHDRTS